MKRKQQNFSPKTYLIFEKSIARVRCSLLQFSDISVAEIHTQGYDKTKVMFEKKKILEIVSNEVDQLIEIFLRSSLNHKLTVKKILTGLVTFLSENTQKSLKFDVRKFVKTLSIKICDTNL